jgi:hypothetical protein
VKEYPKEYGDIDDKHQAPGIFPDTQIHIHRRPGQAKREPGPVTTNPRVGKGWSRYPSRHRLLVVGSLLSQGRLS